MKLVVPDLLDDLLAHLRQSHIGPFKVHRRHIDRLGRENLTAWVERLERIRSQ